MISVPQRSEQPIVLSNANANANANAIVEYLEMTHAAMPVFPDGSRALQFAFVHYLNDVVVKPLLAIMVAIPRICTGSFLGTYQDGDARLSGPRTTTRGGMASGEREV